VGEAYCVEGVLFAVTAVLALAGGVGVIAAREPVHSVLGLLLVLISLAADYLLLGAQFIAALQVIIYAGAIVVLFVFIVMLLNTRSGEGRPDRVLPPALAIAGLRGAGDMAPARSAVPAAVATRLTSSIPAIEGARVI